MRGAGWGALWGLIAGALFFVPVVGGVAGAAIGAISKATEGTGITKEQLERIRVEVTEGTSALFAVTDQGDLDRLGERFTGLHSKLIATDLTAEERKVAAGNLRRLIAAIAVGQRQARLTAEITALSEAVTMLGSNPTPQRIFSPTAHSTYAAAIASPPDERACSA